jgi:hypothetical protein
MPVGGRPIYENGTVLSVHEDPETAGTITIIEGILDTTSGTAVYVANFVNTDDHVDRLIVLEADIAAFMDSGTLPPGATPPTP